MAEDNHECRNRSTGHGKKESRTVDIVRCRNKRRDIGSKQEENNGLKAVVFRKLQRKVGNWLVFWKHLPPLVSKEGVA